MAFIKDYLFVYFKQQGIVSDFHDLLVLLFNDDSIPTTGSIPNRFANDILPGYIKERFNEYSGETDQWIAYYEQKLYPLLLEKNHGNFTTYYQILREGISIYCDDEKRIEIYQNAKDKKALIPPLMNSKIPATLLYRFLDIYLKSGKAIDSSPRDFAIMLYSLIYYGCYGFLSPKYGTYIRGINQDIFEYQKEVVEQYGYVGNSGTQAVFYLAHKDKPNAIALYEIGDLYYYGKVPNGKVDKNKAYEYYKKALECNSYNPLAGYSLGYMQYYYNTSVLYGVKIDELENLTCMQRKMLAFQNINASFEYGYSYAAITLSEMCEDQDIPIYIRRKCLPKQEYLFIASKDHNYIAKNRLGYYYYQEAMKQTDERFRVEYLQQSYDLIEQAYEMTKTYYNEIPILQLDLHTNQLEIKIIDLAARMREIWAINQLAIYLYKQGRYEESFIYFLTSAKEKNDEACYYLLKLFIYNSKLNAKLFFEKNTQESYEEAIHQYKLICALSFDSRYRDYVRDLQN